MGSRGSDFEDGIKKNRILSNAEKRIIAEGTSFSRLPNRGLSREVYYRNADRALEIMRVAKSKAILNSTLNKEVIQQPNFMKDLVNGKLKKSNGMPIADGGLFVSENSPQMDNYIKRVLGYTDTNGDPDKVKTGDIISNILQGQDIFNMKYSDKYSVKINNSTESGQIFEFNLDVPDINGNMHDTYVKIINIHGKNGEIYSIIDSIHAPNRDVVPIWT